MLSTKDKILVACEDLAVRQGRGFYNLSMEDLASAAGISKRTIYRHYQSKEEVFEAVVDRILEKILARNIQIFNSDLDFREMAGQLLKNIAYIGNQQILRDLRNHYPMLWNKIDQFRQSKMDLLFNTMFNKGTKLSWRVNPTIARAALFASLVAIINPDFIIENEMTFEEAGGQLIDLFLFGAVEKTT